MSKGLRNEKEMNVTKMFVHSIWHTDGEMGIKVVSEGITQVFRRLTVSCKLQIVRHQ